MGTIDQTISQANYTEPRFNGFVGMPAALHLDEYARHLRAGKTL